MDSELVRPVTVSEFLERIRRCVGSEWSDNTIDGLKAGRQSTVVKGIATTVWSTMEVLEEAAARNLNLIVTHEPTFWCDEDRAARFPGNRLAAAKQALIDDHELAILRFHDHGHLRQPDVFWDGLGRAIHLEAYADLPWNYGHALASLGALPEQQATYRIPARRLEVLFGDIRSALQVKTARVIGDPCLLVQSVALSPGLCGLEWAIKGLEKADLLIVGECREWEGVEYARDLVYSGARKALIVLGHAVSEEPGMAALGSWLGEVFPELRVEFVQAGEPFWPPHT